MRKTIADARAADRERRAAAERERREEQARDDAARREEARRTEQRAADRKAEEARAAEQRKAQDTAERQRQEDATRVRREAEELRKKHEREREDRERKEREALKRAAPDWALVEFRASSWLKYLPGALSGTVALTNSKEEVSQSPTHLLLEYGKSNKHAVYVSGGATGQLQDEGDGQLGRSVAPGSKLFLDLAIYRSKNKTLRSISFGLKYCRRCAGENGRHD